jgi:hypothetical protein
MTDYPKCIKAEMLPGPKLYCEFDNGGTRYFPLNEQIELYMAPGDITRLKETHGANLFMTASMSWIGNDIQIDENGDVWVNKKVIPSEMIWKYGQKHLNSANKELLEDAKHIMHPTLQGFRNLSFIGLIIVVAIVVVLIGLLANGAFSG